MCYHTQNQKKKEVKMKCRHCGCELLVKDGIVKSKQRYKCKRCHKTTRENDTRCKYSVQKRLKCLKMYSEGLGLKTIERLQGVPNPLIIYWIKHFTSFFKKKLESTEFPKKLSQLEILEIADLNSFVAKNKSDSNFGVLWTEKGIKLLILK